MKRPVKELLLIVGLLGLYSIGVWQSAKYIIPVSNQIEINDLEIRLEFCHFQLLKANAQIQTLKENKDD